MLGPSHLTGLAYCRRASSSSSALRLCTRLSIQLLREHVITVTVQQFHHGPEVWRTHQQGDDIVCLFLGVFWVLFGMLLIASSSTSLMFRLSCHVGGGSEQVRSISVHIRHTRSILEPSGSPQLRYIPECIPALVESLCFFLAEDGHLAGLDSFWIL